MRTLVLRRDAEANDDVRVLQFELERLRRYADQLADALDSILDVTPDLADTHTGLWAYAHDALAHYHFNGAP